MYVVDNEPDTGTAVALDNVFPQATTQDNTGTRAKVDLNKVYLTSQCMPNFRNNIFNIEIFHYFFL